MRQPDGRVALVERRSAGKLSGFALPFEAMVLTLARQMPSAAVARTALCKHNVGQAPAKARRVKLALLAGPESSTAERLSD